MKSPVLQGGLVVLTEVSRGKMSDTRWDYKIYQQVLLTS